MESKKGSVVLRGLRDWDGEVGKVKIVAEAEEESKIAIMGLFLGLQFCDSEREQVKLLKWKWRSLRASLKWGPSSLSDCLWASQWSLTVILGGKFGLQPQCVCRLCCGDGLLVGSRW